MESVLHLSAGGIVDVWPLNSRTMTQQYGNGGTNQLWNMIQISAGSYLIENEKSRLLLNARGINPGSPLVQSGSGGYHDYQIWKLTLAK